jgi:hypothetical protein
MLNAHAPTFHVTTSYVVAVDAEPEAVLADIDRLDLARPIAATIRLLGATERIALAPAALDVPGDGERVYGLAWRAGDSAGAAEPVSPRELAAFDAPGYVKAIWDVRVKGDGDGGSYVSTTVRFVATDAAARAELRAAWRLLGPISADLARRALASLKRIAERAGEPVSYSRAAGFPPATRVLARVA